MMETFTVVGLYEDTGMTYCGMREAETAVDAALMVLDSYPDDPLSIIAVFAGVQQPAYLPEYQERREDA